MKGRMASDANGNGSSKNSSSAQPEGGKAEGKDKKYAESRSS